MSTGAPIVIGKPRTFRNKFGDLIRVYPGVDRSIAKMMVNDQKRARRGHWHSGAKPK